MDISDTLFKLFSKQYSIETGNYLVYINLANQAGSIAWSGFEKFFQEYALDEITNAQKIADFLIGRNRTPLLESLSSPGIKISDAPLDWFETALSKAKEYTAFIRQLYRQCEQEKDEGAQVFLNWYLTEQERVERVFTDFTFELSRAGSNAAVMLVDARFREK